jgi:hypothetical protein
MFERPVTGSLPELVAKVLSAFVEFCINRRRLDRLA